MTVKRVLTLGFLSFAPFTFHSLVGLDKVFELRSDLGGNTNFQPHGEHHHAIHMLLSCGAFVSVASSIDCSDPCGCDHHVWSRFHHLLPAWLFLGRL